VLVDDGAGIAELVGSSARELVGSGGVLVASAGSSTRELVGSAGSSDVLGGSAGSSARELVGSSDVLVASAGALVVGGWDDPPSADAAAMAVPVIAPAATTTPATASPIRVPRPRTCPPRG
jgi:hypothetical protein